MVDRRKLYRFVGKAPLGAGGFARVWKAQRKADGELVAFKEPFVGDDAERRLRREIDVQSQLAHPHIMPILEFDPDRAWFTMPLAEGSLRSLRGGLNEEDLASILHDIAEGLEVAHKSFFVHRDVTPQNILALPYPPGRGGRRWVIADWGLVRRPDSQVSQRLTRSGQGVGTFGFAAPETWLEGHDATSAADVYSLGRVTAWFLRDEEPIPFEDLLPDGKYQHWRGFVRACTYKSTARRLVDMEAVRARLADVFTLPVVPPADRVRELVDNLIIEGGEDIDDITLLALDHPTDGSMYIDHLARIPPHLIEAWAYRTPAEAAQVAESMTQHLLDISWEDRAFDYANTPLHFVHAVLRALVAKGQLGLAEDVAADFFLAEVRWDRWRQKIRTQAWLAELDEPAGQVMVRALRAAGAVGYHRQPPSWRPRSSALRALLAAGPDT